MDDADRPESGGAENTRGSPGSSGSLSMGRAVAVLVVFVVAVVVLVAVGTRPSVSTPSSAATTTTTTATTVPSTGPSAAGSSTSTSAPATTATTARSGHGSGTTTTTVPPGSVSVVVANATSTSGLAGHYTSVIAGAGYNMQAPVNATTSEATSSVYYASGQKQPAEAIAKSIGVKNGQVLALTTSVPVSGVTGVDVVVVIGQDLASASTTTSS